MIKVMASGVFDIIHLGHIHYLNESKKLGDYLVVVVANDKVAERNGKKLVFSQETRAKLVSYMKPVDEAIVGRDWDFYNTVEMLKPQIITLGFDQKFNEKEIEEKSRERGIELKVVRCTPLISDEPFASRKIREKIIEGFK